MKVNINRVSRDEDEMSRAALQRAAMLDILHEIILNEQDEEGERKIAIKDAGERKRVQSRLRRGWNPDILFRNSQYESGVYD